MNVGSRDSVNVFFLNLSCSDDAEDNLGKLEWLRNHHQPEQQVRKWMNDTVKSRAATIRAEKDKPVSELMRLYPRLLDTDGMVSSFSLRYFLALALPYSGKRKQVTKVTFLVKEQNVSVICTDVNGIS